MPVLLLIRHAQASFGTADYDVLSDVGVQQAEALHGALNDAGVVAQALVSGDLRRQRDSAEPWTRRGAALARDERWNEYAADDVLRSHSDVQASLEAPRDGDDMSSRTFQDILDVALAHWVTAGAVSGAEETWPSFRSRCIEALHDLAGALGRGETGLVFTSGGVVAVCAAALLGAPDEVFITLNRTAVNSGVTKVLVGRRGLSLASYNAHGHLRADQVTYR